MQILLPERSQTPLNGEQYHLLEQCIAALTAEQAAWLGGYLTGVAGKELSSVPETSEITILVGSQTGNCEALAEQMRYLASARGLNAVIKKMGDYKFQQLKVERYLLVIVSTYGEGEPPDNAKDLAEHLFSKRAPLLEHLQFAVLGLGDSSYEFFCQTGIDFDRRLLELGAMRIYPRVDCDVDYESSAEAWMEGVLTELASRMQTKPQSPKLLSSSVAAGSGYSRKNPFPALLLENIVLNGLGSEKETRHLEFSLEGAGLCYEPGDALGIYPSNAPDVVEALLKVLHFDGTERVKLENEDISLYDALCRHYEITTMTRPMLKKYALLANNKHLEQLLQDSSKLNDYLHGREIIDLLEDFPAAPLSPQAFTDCLRKLPPRLYSIASSLKQHPGEVHITVAVVRYRSHGRERKGTCSTFLAERIDDDSTVPVYIEHNNNFKLPDDPSRPIIMIGPGTGIAPFRAFIEEREAIGAQGKSWLFFGDRHFETDFLYQAEWLSYLKKGVLTRMNVAFSRDQQQKIYVQHLLEEHGKELFEWLQQGAYLYVCGDGKNMAPDVHQALLKIVAAETGADNAEDYVASLQKAKRYQRDVY